MISGRDDMPVFDGKLAGVFDAHSPLQRALRRRRRRPGSVATDRLPRAYTAFDGPP
jgi:hypothetical protein